MKKAVIIVKNLSKTFGKLKAVDDISFTIFEGEVVALLGPNGAGKTTTIRCLTSLSKPDSAQSILIDGLDLTQNLHEARKRIGVCPQELNLYKSATVIENLELQGYYYQLSKEESKKQAEKLLKLINLQDKKHILVKHLSGGMMRRLQIARALIAQPKVIFLDEPTVGLSPESRNDLWNYIRFLRNQGFSILLTTHYMEEADALADRVLIMNKGRIFAEGTSEDLKSKFVGNSQALIKAEDISTVTQKLQLLNMVYTYVSDEEVSIKSLNGRFPELFKQLEGLEITELTIKKPSLEDVFLELTGMRIQSEQSTIKEAL